MRIKPLAAVLVTLASFTLASFALAACGSGGGTTAASGAAAPSTASPTAVEESACNGQSWPHAVPPVVGMILTQAETRLSCFNLAHATAPDGSDVFTQALAGDWRITAVTPAAGTQVSRTDPITVRVEQIASSEAAVLEPCAWVTDAEASQALGGGPTTSQPAGDIKGSVEPSCTYRSSGRSLSVSLSLPGDFAVSAQSAFALDAAAGAHGGAPTVPGLGSKAVCVAGQTPSLFVLLPGDRLLSVIDWSASDCSAITGLARTAVSRIG